MKIFTEKFYKNTGQIATEFALVLPFAVLLIVSAIAIAMLGVRGIAVQSAAMRAARFAAIFQDEAAILELNKALAPNLFSGGVFEIKALDNNDRISNEDHGMLNAYAVSNGALDIKFGSIVRRTSSVVPALSRGLGNKTLRGGDSPSPYCRTGGGYEVCGFPE